MKRRVARPMSVLAIMFMVVVDVLATCGGGGGGGTGGMSGGAMSEVVYQVPWKYDAVRSKEMMEARVDAVFASIVKEPEFMALTAGADGKLPMPRNRH